MENALTLEEADDTTEHTAGNARERAEEICCPGAVVDLMKNFWTKTNPSTRDPMKYNHATIIRELCYESDLHATAMFPKKI